jgi:predicted Zn-dependent protease
MPRRLVTSLISLLLFLGAAPHAVQGQEGARLPDLGDASSRALTPQEEAQIGRNIVRQMHEAGFILQDAEAEEYIQSLGQRLAAHSSRPGDRFEFFIVNSTDINAFALPGGYIGINAGLILASDDESELAGVMAHEIVHVTQRHIARQFADAQTSGLAMLGAVLAGIAIGVSTGHADAAMAGMMSAQAMGIQRQINFTRAHEHEADRLGIQILASAGYDPGGMARFFEKLQRRYRLTGAESIPEYLRTHPLTANRLSEARARARDLGSGSRGSSRHYYLSRARLDALTAGSPDRQLIAFTPERSPSDEKLLEELNLFTEALDHLFRGRPASAAPIFERLGRQADDVIAYRTGLAEALYAMGRHEDAIKVYEEANRLFPRNGPLVESFARSLIDGGDPARAERLIQDLHRVHPLKPRQIRLMARAATAAGRPADSHYYMADYYRQRGQIYMAITQIRLALENAEGDPHQIARYESRNRELMDEWNNLPSQEQRAQRPREF